MSANMKTFIRWFDAITSALCTLYAVLFGVFTFLICVDIVFRRIGWGSMPWLVELIEYLMYGGTFLVAAWVLRRGEHVRVDLLIGSLKKSAAIALERVIDLLGFFVSVVMAWYGAANVLDAYQAHIVQFKNLIIAEWLLLLPIPIGCALLAIEFVLRIAGARVGAEKPHVPIDFVDR
jgi:TRAP-type C4-dicarboxylate transport system permease small subunit